MNEYQKTADMVFKIIAVAWGTLLFFDIMKLLPNFISDRIMNIILGKIGL